MCINEIIVCEHAGLSALNIMQSIMYVCQGGFHYLVHAVQVLKLIDMSKYERSECVGVARLAGCVVSGLAGCFYLIRMDLH